MTLTAITCQGHLKEVQLNTSVILQVDGGCTIRTGQNIINPVIQAKIPVLSTAIKAVDINLTENIIRDQVTDIQLATEPIIKLTGQNAGISPSDDSIADIPWPHSVNKYPNHKCLGTRSYHTDMEVQNYI